MQATNLIIASTRRNQAGFPESWYPVALLKHLKHNIPKLITLAGSEWVLFRSQDNIGCLSRYCTHMGADLMNGVVSKQGLSCALHGWTFSADGRCIQHGGSCLHSLTCKVMCGVVFAYWGKQAPYDLPFTQHYWLYNKTHIQYLPATHHAVSLNTFDLQHYQRVHNRKIIGKVDIERIQPRVLRIKMKTKILVNHWTDWVMLKLSGGQMAIEIDCWSTGILTMKNLSTGYGAIVAMAPLAPEKTDVYITPVINTAGQSLWKKVLYKYITLRLALIFVKAFLAPDIKVLSGMRPTEGNLLEGVDDAAKDYWEFYRNLPRYSLQKSPYKKVLTKKSL